MPIPPTGLSTPPHRRTGAPFKSSAHPARLAAPFEIGERSLTFSPPLTDEATYSMHRDHVLALTQSDSSVSKASFSLL